ncbi:hypothetical protein SOM08_14405 [Hydrogenophaga sp. SNF1]|uniref:hypothetical protein n=1 Tax=Hydrogenophaga sp. SNF1 TaxID=3098762 RepID=UPI002ACBDD60|nr:hypothetical protein [Hydrogenophaga sp. SNF1]WQB82189.1 hypothetical protein SOM08_14405 [Hydrogenophaga sp. SNF1]
MEPSISAVTQRKRKMKRSAASTEYWFISSSHQEEQKFAEFVVWCRDNWHGSEVDEDWGYDMQREVIFELFDGEFDPVNDEFTLRLWTTHKGDASLFKLRFSEHFKPPAS